MRVRQSPNRFTGDVRLSGAVHDGAVWRLENEQALRLALGLNNGGQPSTVPRQRGFTALDFDYKDLVPLNASARQFQMAVFDGRRMLFLPFGTFYAPLGTLAAYEVSKPFSADASWQFATLPTVTGEAQAVGFLGGVLDLAGWLYFCPCIVAGGTGVTVGPNKALRFNTLLEIGDPAAYEVFDLSTIAAATGGPPTQYYSWQSSVCDGRYVYYVPCTKQNTATVTNVSAGVNPTVTTSAAHGLVAGDLIIISGVLGATGVNGSFTITTAPTTTTFTLTTGAPGTYQSAGTISCITPSGQFLRFDTQGVAGAYASAFLNPANHSVFDLTTVNAQAVAMLGGVYDGRYVYLVPFALATGSAANGLLVRYDTADLRGFRDTASYSTVDLEALLSPAANFTTANNAARAVAFCGGIMVGPYLVLTPFGGGAGLVGGVTAQRSLAVLYDTRLALSDANSYRTFDLRTIARQVYTVTGVTNVVNPVLTIGTHTLTVGQYVNISGVVGATGVNKTLYVQAVAATTITVTLATQPGVYSSGGSATSGADECVGYQFGGFDGQYVHFTPSYNANRSATDCVCPPYVRWDVRLPFEEAASWTYVNTPLQGVFAIPAVATGLGFDGRYLYHSPYTGLTATYAPVVRVNAGAPNLAGMVDPLPDLYRGPSKLGENVVIEDDLNSGGTATGNIGTIGMVIQGITAVTQIAAEANHPGIITFTSSAVLNSPNAVAFRPGAVGTFHCNGNSAFPFDLIWLVRLKAPGVEPTYRIGLVDDISTAAPASAIYFERLAAETSWRIVTRVGGVATRVATGYAASVANTWHRLRIKWDGVYLKFSVNGSALQVVGGPNQAAGAAWVVPAPPTLPTAALTPFASLIPASAAAQTFDVDYVKLVHTGFTR